MGGKEGKLKIRRQIKVRWLGDGRKRRKKHEVIESFKEGKEKIVGEGNKITPASPNRCPPCLALKYY